MAGPTFLGDLGYALAAPGQVIDNFASEYDVVIIEDDERLRRRLESNNSTEDDAAFDLSKYLQFSVARGSENAADAKLLNFTVSSKGVEGDYLKFSIDFADPDLVSIGADEDELRIRIVDPQFFSSSASGSTVRKGHEIRHDLPRMLTSKEFKATVDAVNTGLQIGIIAQIAITVPIAISLKSMWNFLNVVQVLAYMRFYARWPAFIEEQLK